MKSIKFALLYGFLIWLIVFAVSIVAFPLREPNWPLFESIMPVALTACVTVFAVAYFRRVDIKPLRHGIWLGLIWLAVNLALDQLMFSWGPMKMSLADYMSDIGVTYLLIPIIPIGMGVLLSQR
jgi:hypothetical protein